MLSLASATSALPMKASFRLHLSRPKGHSFFLRKVALGSGPGLPSPPFAKRAASCVLQPLLPAGTTGGSLCFSPRAPSSYWLVPHLSGRPRALCRFKDVSTVLPLLEVNHIPTAVVLTSHDRHLFVLAQMNGSRSQGALCLSRRRCSL